jgi:hypothetical protein
MTLAVYFCSQCQKVESGVTFPPDPVATGEVQQSNYDDMLSQLYYEHKAFRRN